MFVIIFLSMVMIPFLILQNNTIIDNLFIFK